MGGDTTASTERIVRANGVDLCVETFGDPADPAILLISGASSSMHGWPDGLCRRLADSGRLVIRYDHRDTGRSVTYPPGAPGYTGDDLVADAVGVLDAVGAARGHLVGVSMGGALAQVAALDHPDRVASLTLIATSPDGPGSDSNGLPPMAAALQEFFAAGLPEPDWSDREAVIEYLTAAERPFAGPSTFDESAVRAAAARTVDRSANLASAANHYAVAGGEPWRERLGTLTVPTLVIHGTLDPLFPYEHGVALAREIPGAELLPLPGVGHEVPPPATWDVVVPAIVRHTAAAR